MTAAEALNKLVDHLLGENWYSIYMNAEDVYKDIVDTICSRYRGKKRRSGDTMAQAAQTLSILTSHSVSG